MNKRRVTKPIYVGGVKIGGDAEVTVQSMTKTDTRDVAATVPSDTGAGGSRVRHHQVGGPRHGGGKKPSLRSRAK